MVEEPSVEPIYYGHQGDRDKCPHYRGVRFREVGFIWISVFQGPSELSVIERCPYYRGIRKERFHCILVILYLGVAYHVLATRGMAYHL